MSAPCRQVDEASYKKLERLFDMAMSDPMNDREVQPQALIRAKSRVRHHPIHCHIRQIRGWVQRSTFLSRRVSQPGVDSALTQYAVYGVACARD